MTVVVHKVLSWILEESVVEATWKKEYEVMHWPLVLSNKLIKRGFF